MGALWSLAGCQHRLIVQETANKPAELYDSRPVQVEYGIASWYGGRWIGRKTANGETYRAGDMTAAHKKLPFHSKVRVTELRGGKSVIVRINNRGPYVKGRIIDLSVEAAKALGTYERGLARVRLEVLREIPVLRTSNLRAKNPPKPGPLAKPLPTEKSRANR
jgi:rare lipoprotein A